MSGYNVIVADFHCTSVELVKFKMSVAVDTGVGSYSVFVCIYESVDYLFTEAVGKIENIVRHTQ